MFKTTSSHHDISRKETIFNRIFFAPAILFKIIQALSKLIRFNSSSMRGLITSVLYLFIDFSIQLDIVVARFVFIVILMSIFQSRARAAPSSLDLYPLLGQGQTINAP